MLPPWSFPLVLIGGLTLLSGLFLWLMTRNELTPTRDPNLCWCGHRPHDGRCDGDVEVEAADGTHVVACGCGAYPKAEDDPLLL